MAQDPRWPDLFVIGAAKAGTTSLYHHLDAHPEIHMSPVKEPDFFSATLDEADDPDALEAAIEEYLSLFDGADDALHRGEASPSYLTSSRAPDRIRERCPDPHLILLLRDPIERAYSHYLMGWRDGNRDERFADAVEQGLAAFEGAGGPRMPFLGPSRYHTHLRPWIDTFGLDRIEVLLTEDLRKDPDRVLGDLATWLGVRPDGFQGADLDRKHNPYREPRNELTRWLRTSEPVKQWARRLIPERARSFLGDKLLLKRDDKPTMSPETVEALWAYYEPEIEALEDLLGRDLDPLWSTHPQGARP